MSAQLALQLGLRKAPDDQRVLDLLVGLELGDWSVLIDTTTDELTALYADGTKRALKILRLDTDTTTNEARAQLGLGPIDSGGEVPAIVGQVNDRAHEWGADRAAELVTLIEENTRTMLRAAVTQAIEQGLSAAELADVISESAAFSTARAQMIARTELIRANNQGNLAAYKASGVAAGKEWATADDEACCAECDANEAQGAIPLDDDFDSGDDAPPAHPNCRCALLPVTDIGRREAA